VSPLVLAFAKVLKLVKLTLRAFVSIANLVGLLSLSSFRRQSLLVRWLAGVGQALATREVRGAWR
jgi:hypothetical protein